MIALSDARAAEYAGRKPCRREDGALESKIMEALKQIEEGQWSEKRDLSGGIGIDVIKAGLNAGRQRVADEKKARDAKAALDLGNKI